MYASRVKFQGVIQLLSETQFATLVRTSAAYDVLATAPFLTPWSFQLLVDMVRQLHAAMGLPGQIPDFEPTHMLLANLLGAVVLVWSAVRLHLGLPLLGRYDALARALFATLQIHAVVAGASPVLLLFTLFEIGFGVAQVLPYHRDTAAAPHDVRDKRLG